jgi:hypothetical protein
MTLVCMWNDRKIYHLVRENDDRTLENTLCGCDTGSWLWGEKPPKDHRICVNCERLSRLSSNTKEHDNADG